MGSSNAEPSFPSTEVERAEVSNDITLLEQQSSANAQNDGPIEEGEESNLNVPKSEVNFADIRTNKELVRMKVMR